MPKRAETEIRRRIEASGDLLKIEQLCLDGIQIGNITPNIKRLLESCTSLEYLTINDCELRSLENFPLLKNLVVLEMTDNQLTGEDLDKLATSPQLKFLTLVNNRISSMSSLQKLNKLAELQILQIHDNEVCEEDNYRESIFEMLPTLNAVDCIDREGCPVEEESPSEYISNVENSRLDLLDLIQGDDDYQKDDFVRTAASYMEEGAMNRRDSIETSNSPTGSMLSLHLKPTFHQNSIMFMRTGVVSDSEQEEDDDLIRDFKRKFQKKD